MGTGMKEWDAKMNQRDASGLPNHSPEKSELGCDWADKISKCGSNQRAKDGGRGDKRT